MLLKFEYNFPTLAEQLDATVKEDPALRKL
jgi:hypothetical protein